MGPEHDPKLIDLVEQRDIQRHFRREVLAPYYERPDILLLSALEGSMLLTRSGVATDRSRTVARHTEMLLRHDHVPRPFAGGDS